MNEIITIIKDITTILAMITGTVIAYLGLRTWNAQLKGTTKYKIAKEILTKTFNLRDEFYRTRSILITNAEKSHVVSNKEETFEDLSFKAYHKRLENLNNAKRELEIIKLEADAVFGEEETKGVGKLIAKVDEMNKNFNIFYEMTNNNLSEEERNMRGEARWILFGTGYETDNFGMSINELVDSIKKRFRRYLK
jgi:hypothetical protein